MIESNIFQSFAFPCLLLDEQGDEVLRHSGSLFICDMRCQRQEAIESYKKIPLGWSKCNSGYAVYKLKLPTPNSLTLIIYGIKVAGVSTISGKSAFLSIKTEKSDVENYVKNMIRVINDCDSYFKSFIAGNIHEIRSINANIYNTILQLRQDIDRRSFQKDKDMPVLKNIESLSEVLKVRSDYIDVVSRSVISDLYGGKTSVYKKFDKLSKSLMPFARANKVHINLYGESHSYINGLKLFEVIPYLLLHNGIKYASADSKIDIDIQESKDHVVVVFQSLGPQLFEEEKDKIFNFGFRGKYARDLSSEGNGIGLYFLKQLVELHDGASIQFFQENQHYTIERNIPYCRTSFTLRFKIVHKAPLEAATKLLKV